MAKHTNPNLIEKIKQTAIVGMFSDDELMSSMVLKGGNAMDLIYKISSRASVDCDFSMHADFPGGSEALMERVERSMKKAFQDEDLHAFDFKVDDAPKTLSDDLKSFWGGYSISFKLIATDKAKKFATDPEGKRRNAINLGQSTKFLIDVSRFEYLEGNIEESLNGYTIFVYSPTMIVAEKLRAICQQMPEYAPVVKRSARPGSSRARDFFDIYLLVTEANVDLATEEGRALVRKMFEAKKVPLELLGKLDEHRSIHEESYRSLKDTVRPGIEVQPFEFYFNFVKGLVTDLDL